MVMKKVLILAALFLASNSVQASWLDLVINLMSNDNRRVIGTTIVMTTISTIAARYLWQSNNFERVVPNSLGLRLPETNSLVTNQGSGINEVLRSAITLEFDYIPESPEPIDANVDYFPSEGREEEFVSVRFPLGKERLSGINGSAFSYFQKNNQTAEQALHTLRNRAK